LDRVEFKNYSSDYLNIVSFKIIEKKIKNIKNYKYGRNSKKQMETIIIFFENDINIASP